MDAAAHEFALPTGPYSVGAGHPREGLSHFSPARSSRGSAFPCAQTGDVDKDGEIIDEVLLANVQRLTRLARAIGGHRAVDVDAESQLRLTLSLLERRACM